METDIVLLSSQLVIITGQFFVGRMWVRKLLFNIKNGRERGITVSFIGLEIVNQIMKEKKSFNFLLLVSESSI